MLPSGGIKTVYDAQLPPNYVELLSDGVMELFRKDKFEVGGVPEFVPPLEVR